MKPLAELREDYRRAVLDEASVATDPLAQFTRWLDDARAAELKEPNAMTLATVDAHGHPRARIVLLKGVQDGGFVFYTNFESDKGHELLHAPHAALVFAWLELERQVRIEGSVTRVSLEVADAYFASRPRGSQLGAWASPQSQKLASREPLEEALREVTERYDGKDVPRPPHWGGYLVTPTMLEFWQGRPNRLHDRLRYTRVGRDFQLERLAP